MTCAACAARIEKKLNKMDGVQASVNYATHKAMAVCAPSVTTADLIGTIEKAGYAATVSVPDAPIADHGRALRRRLTVAVALSVPVLVLAMVPPWQFPGWQWVSWVLATPVVFYSGWTFHRSALVNLRHGSATMDTLVSLGTLAAYLWSVWSLFWGMAGQIGMQHPFELTATRMAAGSSVYFEAAVGVITFVLTGRLIEARARVSAGADMAALLSIGAKTATMIVNGVETTVPVERLRVGDEFVVNPGDKIATDGVVVAGRSAIDAAFVTGESVPVEVSPGSDVIGATINCDGRLVVRATRVGADTQLATIARLVHEAQAGKTAVQRLADTISMWFVPIVLAIALATGVVWLWQGESVAYAGSAAVAVLIIACPCALGLATPTALVVGVGRGAQLGIVIKGPDVLERAHAIRAVVLDKTGTVTTGLMEVVTVMTVPGTSRQELLRYAGIAEHGSTHPVARAIATRARIEAGALPAADTITNVPGLGVRATTADGLDVWVGRPGAADGDQIAVSEQVQNALAAAQQQGRTAVLVAWGGAARGVIAVADTIKPTSAQAIAEFRGLGITPILASGDNETVARLVAAEVGIDEVRAGVLPQDKVFVIAQMRARYDAVAMVGDGVNDAAALASADLGIAMGSGTDAANAAADISVMRSDLLAAVDAIRLAKATLRTIKANLFWAFAYNVAAIPLAAMGYLNPMIAGAAMAFSSVFVVLNSVRLRRFAPLAPASTR